MRDQWIDWLQEKQRHFFYGVIIVVAALFIAFQLFGKFHKPKDNYYLNANTAFEKWMAQGEALENVLTAIDNHPELETKFGALIAEKYISQNEGEKAEVFAKGVLQRVLKQTPEHAAFSHCSLLITKGNLQQAFEQSLSLQKSLGKTSLLYGFNLVRITSLCRALEYNEQEQMMLSDLNQFLNEHSDAAIILSDCFKEGEIALSDYIAHRKN